MKALQAYADTSFVLSHFINDEHTNQARYHVFELSKPLVVSRLVLLEFENLIWRKVGFDGFEKPHAERAIRHLEEQIDLGFFQISEMNQADLWKRAQGLSSLYATELKVRSLDILHVASALDAKVRGFWSFDVRQNALAARVGLTVLEYPKSEV